MQRPHRPLLSDLVNGLPVEVFGDRTAMGAAAANAAANEIRRIQEEREAPVRIVFAAAPSQDEMLDALAAEPGIDWGRVTALHMDEYVGLARSAPQSFGAYLDARLFGRVHPGAVHYIDGAAPAPAECERYRSLVEEGPLDICCMGIGENGHIAFNEPPLAAFDDPELVRVVELDETSRRQQVHDGCFPTLDAVPRSAITLTIPALAGAARIVCTVPGHRKREAVARTLWGPIGPACPATRLRTHPGARLFLDLASWREPTPHDARPPE